MSELGADLHWIDISKIEDGVLYVFGWCVWSFGAESNEEPIVEVAGVATRPLITFSRPDVVKYLTVNEAFGVTPLDAAKSFVFVAPCTDIGSALFRFGKARKNLTAPESTLDRESIRRFERHLRDVRPVSRDVRLALKFLRGLLPDPG